MKNKEYIVLEYEDKKKYDGEMYKIYTKEKSELKYKMKLNRGDYEKFMLDIKIGNIKLYTSLISR
tara:strand:+ start:432 stop:626 length:195 start_codon:yes stop_codon:yes gene_type:complete